MAAAEDKRIDDNKIKTGASLVIEAIEHVLKMIEDADKADESREGGRTGQNVVVTELFNKDLPFTPKQIREIAKWYAERASPSWKVPENWIQEIEDRNELRPFAKYALEKLADDKRKRIEELRGQITRRMTNQRELHNLELQLAIIEKAIIEDYTYPKNKI